MLSFERLSTDGHEQVVYFSDPSCGLKAIVAIHDTTLGPALGGTRMWPYATEQEALEDVLRLSKGMTYKAAVSGLNLGGGKGVIIGDPKVDKSEALFRSYGRYIESLNGRYITAEDVNIRVEDVEHVYTETSYVVGVARIHGGSGNPAPYTALGVFRGMQATAAKTWGDKSLKGKTVAIQGVGAVGYELGILLRDDGANILFTDISKENIERFQAAVETAKFVELDDIYSVDCDVFAPCALGGAINDKTIPQLKAKIVCGAANNQLDENRHGLTLKEKNILYAPDYLINAGGLMNVSIEFEGWSDDKSRRMIDTIYDTSLKVFETSDKEGISCNQAADLVAERRIEQMSKIKASYLGAVSHRFPGRKKRHGI